MKNLVGFAAILLALVAQAEVEFSNVSVRQRWPWSKKVDIRYDVSGLTKASYVRVLIKDNGRDLDICESSLSGDVSGVTDGTDKHIVWDPTKTKYAANKALTDVTVELKAVDHPLYMIIDLKKSAGDPDQYHYIYEDELHAGKYGSVATNPVAGIQSIAWTGVTNGLAYKHEKIALRYVPAGVVHDDAANVDIGISKSCWVGVFEFTEGQYWECFATNTYSIKTCALDTKYTDYGAKNISYGQMRGLVNGDNINWPYTGSKVAPQSRIAQLRKKLGFDTIDLPDVNEWQYAARAGSTAIYSDNKTTAAGVTQANLTDADSGFAALQELGWSKQNSSGAKKVGLKPSNAWGLYDVQGNMHEWGICYCWSGDGRRARFGGCYQIDGWRCGLSYSQAILKSNNAVMADDAGDANCFRLFILNVD